MHVVVAYDVADDGRRERVAQLLLNYGIRVQRSVFECVIKREDFIVLRHRLDQLIQPEEDSLCFYFLCSTCQNRVIRQGVAQGLWEQGRCLIL
jgi:CRISPR-associated protein Cas2